MTKTRVDITGLDVLGSEKQKLAMLEKVLTIALDTPVIINANGDNYIVHEYDSLVFPSRYAIMQFYGIHDLDVESMVDRLIDLFYSHGLLEETIIVRLLCILQNIETLYELDFLMYLLEEMELSHPNILYEYTQTFAELRRTERALEYIDTEIEQIKEVYTLKNGEQN